MLQNRALSCLLVNEDAYKSLSLKIDTSKLKRKELKRNFYLQMRSKTNPTAKAKARILGATQVAAEKPGSELQDPL